MQQARYLNDNRLISAAEYQAAPEHYRGLLLCPLCEEKAWFIKDVSSENINRVACFAAHHQQGCEAATLRLDAQDETTGSQPDKVTEPAVRYAPAGLWQSIKAPQLGGIDGYDVNTALRQLLSHLCRNRDFASQGQKILVLTAADRELISGKLADYLVHINDISDKHLQTLYIFWGQINNVNERECENPVDDELWLNTGDYRKEPSVFIDADLRYSLIRRFKLTDLDALSGADFILLGHAGKSPHGKFTLHIAMSKYIAFRRYDPAE